MAKQARSAVRVLVAIALHAGVTHSLAATYFSQNTSVGVRGYAADRYAKSKDTGYKKVIRDNNLQLHSRSAVMETYGAFSKDLWCKGTRDRGLSNEV